MLKYIIVSFIIFISLAQCQPHTNTFETEQEAQAIRELREQRAQWLMELKAAGIEPVKNNVWVGEVSIQTAQRLEHFAFREEIELIVHYTDKYEHQDSYTLDVSKDHNGWYVVEYLYFPYGTILEADDNVLVLHDLGRDSARAAAEQLVLPMQHPDGVKEWPSVH